MENCDSPDVSSVHQRFQPGGRGTCRNAVGTASADFKPEIETLFRLELERNQVGGGVTPAVLLHHPGIRFRTTAVHVAH